MITDWSNISQKLVNNSSKASRFDKKRLVKMSLKYLFDTSLLLSVIFHGSFSPSAWIPFYLWQMVSVKIVNQVLSVKCVLCTVKHVWQTFKHILLIKNLYTIKIVSLVKQRSYNVKQVLPVKKVILLRCKVPVLPLWNKLYC